MNKEQLLERAQELKIKVPEGATNKQISDLILIAEHPILKDSIEKLDKRLGDAVSDLADANSKLAEASATKTEFEAVITEGKEEIAVLKAALDAALEEDEEKSRTSFKHDGDIYSFAVESFRFKGEKYTTEEAIKNEELISDLIEAGFIHLKKQ